MEDERKMMKNDDNQITKTSSLGESLTRILDSNQNRFQSNTLLSAKSELQI